MTKVGELPERLETMTADLENAADENAAFEEYDQSRKDAILVRNAASRIRTLEEALRGIVRCDFAQDMAAIARAALKGTDH